MSAVKLHLGYSPRGQGDKVLAIYTQAGGLYPGGAHDAHVVAALAEQANQLAKKLRDANPGLGVP